MSKHDNRPDLDSDYEDRIFDEYLAAKDALDADRERAYGAGLSGVAEQGSSRSWEDDYAFNFGDNAQADLDFTKSAAAATAAAAAEAGLDMSGYLHGGDGKSSKASKKDSRKKKHNKKHATSSESGLYEDDEISMTASEEGLERFMRSLGFEDEEKEIANASGEVVEKVEESVEVGDSFGPAIGVRSPLDGRFDLRSGRVGNALGEGTKFPLLDLDGDYSALPSPEVLAAYPAEVQRKIIEWTDRDVRARRDNESLRQDIILREKIAQRKIVLFFAVLIVVVCIICAVATSVLLRDAIYAVVFLLIPMIVVAAALVWLLGFGVTKR